MHELQKHYEDSIAELAECCVRTAELGYVTSHGGNLSYRVDTDTVLITPTKVPKRRITFDDICVINLNGDVLYASEGRRPTGETPFHIRIFQKRPDLKGLIHAHPPVLTGFAMADTDLLEKPLLPEPIIEVGPMVPVPYAEPLSDELAEAFDDAIEVSNAFLMENHGVMVTSPDGIERALDFLEMYEAAAKSIVVSEVLGGTKVLSQEDVQNLNRTMNTRGLPMPGRPGRVSSLVQLYFS